MPKAYGNTEHSKIEIVHDNIIRLTVRPLPDEESILQAADDIANRIAELRSVHHRVYLLVDVRKLSLKANNKSTRTATRKILALNADAIAVVGSLWAVQTGMYIYKMSKSTKSVGYFKYEQAAVSWLKRSSNRNTVQLRTRNNLPLLALVVFIFITQASLFSLANFMRSDLDNHQAELFEGKSQELANNLDTKMENYIDTLYAFKGLYKSSNSVNALEFESFYNSLDVAQKYPGFRAFTFIAIVPENQINSFLAEKNLDSYLRSKLDGPFTIQQKTDQPTHYIVTYVAPPRASTTKKSLGLDLSYDPVRRKTYTKVLKMKQPSVSDTTVFKTNEKGPNVGFFISMPIIKKNNSAQGVVNAVVFYDSFFQQFNRDSESALDSLALRVTNHTSQGNDEEIYRTKNYDEFKNGSLVSTQKVTFADRVWSIEVHSNDLYSVSTYQRIFTDNFWIIGELMLAFCYLFILSQLRTRSLGYKLADRITADLQIERDNAIKSENKNNAILSSIADGVIATNAHGTITAINGAAEELLGLGAHSVIGKMLTSIVSLTDKDGNQLAEKDRPLAKVLRTKKPHSVTLADAVYYRRKDGISFPVALKVTPLKESNKVIGAVEVFSNLSRDTEFEAAKDDFMSIVSHQLQTPVAAVKQFISLILDGYADNEKEVKKLLQSAYQANEDQIVIIQDLLETARLESGRSTLNLQETNVAEFLKRIVGRYKKLNNANNVIVQYSEGLAVSSYLDQAKIKMCVENLISNAIKYNKPNGSTTVSYTADHNHLYISVKDTGFGIREHDKGKLFKRFGRLSNSSTDNVTGTGLGLYLVKKIVDMHNGSVAIKSNVGKGTEFIIKLPLRRDKI